MRNITPLLALALLALTGCQSGFARYYVPQSVQHEYPPAEQTRIVQLGAQDLNQTQARLYPDAEVIGAARFTGGEESTNQLRKFARSVGADVVLWKRVLLGEVAYLDYTAVPRTDTTHVTSRVNGKPVTHRVLTYGTDYVPYTRTRSTYLHEAVFLRTRSG